MPLGYHSRTYHTGPTTLVTSDPDSFGAINTGTRNPNMPITQSSGDRVLQVGSEDNTAQTKQAVGGFMDSRKTKPMLDRAVVHERRMDMQIARQRLNGDLR